ncbi:MAG: helix-turn-helix domain-containing protein [Candidatus Thiodiazotropha endolucinida]
MSTYTQLTQEQRYQIYALNKADHNQSEIAEIVGVHKSTISRELRRNRGLRGYRPKQAHQLATHRRQSNVSFRMSPEDWRLIDQLLREE